MPTLQPSAEFAAFIIPRRLIADLIDTINDRVENLQDIEDDDSRDDETRRDCGRLKVDLIAIIQELDDPGSVTWRRQESEVT